MGVGFTWGEDPLWSHYVTSAGLEPASYFLMPLTSTPYKEALALAPDSGRWSDIPVSAGPVLPGGAPASADPGPEDILLVMLRAN